jgi:hypothetical protein
MDGLTKLSRLNSGKNSGNFIWGQTLPMASEYLEIYVEVIRESPLQSTGL